MLTALLALAPLAGSCGTTGHQVYFEAGPGSFEVEQEHEQAWARGLAAEGEVREEPDGSVLARIQVALAPTEPEAIRIEKAELMGWALDVPDSSGFEGDPPDGVLRPQEFSLSRIEVPAVSPAGVAAFELRFTYPEGPSVDISDLDGLELYLFIKDGAREGDIVIRFYRRF